MITLWNSFQHGCAFYIFHQSLCKLHPLHHAYAIPAYNIILTQFSSITSSLCNPPPSTHKLRVRRQCLVPGTRSEAGGQRGEGGGDGCKYFIIIINFVTLQGGGILNSILGTVLKSIRRQIIQCLRTRCFATVMRSDVRSYYRFFTRTGCSAYNNKIKNPCPMFQT